MNDETHVIRFTLSAVEPTVTGLNHSVSQSIVMRRKPTSSERRTRSGPRSRISAAFPESRATYVTERMPGNSECWHVKAMGRSDLAAPQQVMLEVRFLEVNRSAGHDLGMNLYGANANGTNIGNSGLGTINTASGRIPMPNTGPPTGSIPLLDTAGTLASGAVPFGSLLTSVLRMKSGASIDLLVTALLRRLAEPNLMALSGDAARFLTGGEFPVPVASTAGTAPTVTIEFKKFGVELAFVPTVLSRGVINLRVEPSVSELDFQNAVTIAGEKQAHPRCDRSRSADYSRRQSDTDLLGTEPATRQFGHR